MLSKPLLAIAAFAVGSSLALLVYVDLHCLKVKCTPQRQQHDCEWLEQRPPPEPGSGEDKMARRPSKPTEDLWDQLQRLFVLEWPTQPRWQTWDDCWWNVWHWLQLPLEINWLSRSVSLTADRPWSSKKQSIKHKSPHFFALSSHSGWEWRWNLRRIFKHLYIYENDDPNSEIVLMERQNHKQT